VVFDCPGYGLIFSPDETQGAFWDGRSVHLLDLNRNRLTEVNLLPSVPDRYDDSWSFEWAPDNSMLAALHETTLYVLRPADRTTQVLHVVQSGAPGAPVTDNLTRTSLFAWQPRGLWLRAILNDKSVLFLVSPQTGGVLTVASGVSEWWDWTDGRTCGWLADGSIVVVDEDTLYQVWPSGRSRKLYKKEDAPMSGHESMMAWQAVLSAKKVVMWGLGWSISEFDLESETERHLIGAAQYGWPLSDDPSMVRVAMSPDGKHLAYATPQSGWVSPPLRVRTLGDKPAGLPAPAPIPAPSARTAAVRPTAPASPWPQFHGDAQRTGRSRYAGPARGRVKWRLDLGSAIESSPVIGRDGAVLVITSDHALVAVSPEGTLLWRLESSQSTLGSVAVGRDGVIYAVLKDRGLSAINPAGSVKWSLADTGREASQLAVAQDGNVFVGSDDTLSEVSADGRVVWRSARDQYHDHSIVSISKEGLLFAVDNHRVSSLDRLGGKRWKSEFVEDNSGAYGLGSGVAVAPDGDIVLTSNQGRLCKASQDAAVRWRVRVGYDVYSVPAIATDGTIYVGTDWHYLYAVAPNGTVRWKFRAWDEINSSPAVDTEGRIYFGSDDGAVYCLNRQGTLLWRVFTDSWVVSSPAIGADGVLYIGSGDGYLYAIE